MGESVGVLVFFFMEGTQTSRDLTRLVIAAFGPWVLCGLVKSLNRTGKGLGIG